ncbi:DUF885 family protein, partial [Staphylococcus aureus]|nr:DUF885 family protein [Staphylococcus aureus]
LARGHLEIRRMPLAQEPGAPAAYGGPGTIDGSVPGKVWVNLGDPSIHNRVTIPDLVYHEGIPGHVWQGEYAQALPLIRSILRSTPIRKAGRSMPSSSPTSWACMRAIPPGGWVI